MSSFHLYILSFFLSNFFLMYKFYRCLAKYSSILFLFVLSSVFIDHVFRSLFILLDDLLVIYWNTISFHSFILCSDNLLDCFITCKTLYIKELSIRVKMVYFLEKLDPFIFLYIFYFSSCQEFKTLLCYHTEETSMDIFALFLKFRSKGCFYQFHVS